MQPSLADSPRTPSTQPPVLEPADALLPPATESHEPSSVRRSWLIAGLLSCALVPRLDVAFRIPVGQPQWFWRADLFWSRLESGDLAGTFLAPHPGLTVLWLAGGAQRLAGAQTARAQALASSLATLAVDLLLLAILLSLVFRLTQRLGGRAQTIATGTSGLLIAFDPQLIPMTGLVGLDGMFALSACCVLLLIACHGGEGGRAGTLSVAALSGFAVATKGAGLALLFAPVLGAATVSGSRLHRWRDALVLTGAIAAVSAAAVILLLPAVWVDPGRIIDRLVFGFGGTKESLLGVLLHERAEELRGFDNAPGAFVYFVHLLFRATPIALLGLAAGVCCRSFRRDSSFRFLGTFGVLFFVLLALAAQKEWRYLIPLLVLLDVVAGLGVAHLSLRLRRSPRALRLSGLVVIALAAQSLWVLSAAPHYEFRLNPLFGGLRTAYRRIAVGWGGGLERAHEVLARQAEERHREIRWTGGYGNSGERDRKGLEFESRSTRWLGSGANLEESDCHVFYVRNQTPARRAAEEYWREHGSQVYELVLDGVSITSVWCRDVPVDAREPDDEPSPPVVSSPIRRSS